MHSVLREDRVISGLGMTDFEGILVKRFQIMDHDKHGTFLSIRK